MNFRKCVCFILGVVVLIILPLSLIACQATTEVPSEGAAVGEVVIIPMSGKLGTSITIAGAGFVPGERVDLVLAIGGVESLLGQKAAKGFIVANEYGAFVTTSNIPRMLNPGAYTIEARGDEGTDAFSPLEVIE